MRLASRLDRSCIGPCGVLMRSGRYSQRVRSCDGDGRGTSLLSVGTRRAISAGAGSTIGRSRGTSAHYATRRGSSPSAGRPTALALCRRSSAAVDAKGLAIDPGAMAGKALNPQLADPGLFVLIRLFWCSTFEVTPTDSSTIPDRQHRLSSGRQLAHRQPHNRPGASGSSTSS